MEYVLTFLEGIASFISPCILPMIPIYISYFMGKENKSTSKAVINSVGFVCGFTISFVLLAVIANALGGLMAESIKYIKIVFGILIIILGLSYMEVLNIKFLNNTKAIKLNPTNMNFFKTLLFGLLFSVSWTPCVGTFLSSALLLVAVEQELIKGIGLILIYSIGLGVPFIISAVLIDKLKTTFNFIKKNYSIVKKISAVILIVMGIYMIFF